MGPTSCCSWRGTGDRRYVEFMNREMGATTAAL
jgi:hypothetical protein